MTTNLQLFWAKVEKTDECWNWLAACDRDGYGVWSFRSKNKSKQVRVHRLSYDLAYGNLSELLTIDHLCKNKRCLNPEHLEQVSLKENVRRSVSFNGSKTHCKNGHEFTKENTYIYKGKKRNCKKCHLITEKKRYYMQKAQK